MRSLALMYHRVNTLQPDPWTTCVSPAHFAEHLEVIRSLPFPVTITFDDGYADNFENARPLLEKYDVPATVFVTSGMIGSPLEMWWDELERKYLAGLPPGYDWDAGHPSEPAAQYLQMFHNYRRQPFPIFETRPAARLDRRMMTAEEIATLPANGLITIGAHTVTHPVLSHLDERRQREEITCSKLHLEEIIGKEVSLFSYPNGWHSDYTNETVRLVHEAGFQRAYAAWEGWIDAAADRFQIPRIMVRDWDGDEFSAVIHRRISL